MKKYFFLIPLVLTTLFSFGVAFAADPTQFTITPISTSLPGVGGSDPVGMIGNLYTFALAFSALLAFGAIVYGGIEYTVAGGNTSTQSEGRDRIKQALYGLLLLVGAYIILKTINPGLLELKLPTLSQVSVPTNQGGGPGGTGGTGGPGPIDRTGANPQLTDAEARAKLQSYLDNGTISIKSGAGAASLEGMRQDTVEEAIKLQEQCSCTIEITSGTDGNHSTNGEFSHSNGYKMDVRPSSDLDNFITHHFSYQGVRGDGAPLWSDPASGAVYAREGNHWDIQVK